MGETANNQRRWLRRKSPSLPDPPRNNAHSTRRRQRRTEKALHEQLEEGSVPTRQRQKGWPNRNAERPKNGARRFVTARHGQEAYQGPGNLPTLCALVELCGRSIESYGSVVAANRRLVNLVIRQLTFYPSFPVVKGLGALFLNGFPPVAKVLSNVHQRTLLLPP